MRLLTVLRARSAWALAALLLLAAALAACDDDGLGDARLLASAYAETQSRLVLIDPANLDGDWVELATIEHAAGWDVEGVVAPSGDAAALLAVPPNGREPREDAVLWLVTAQGKRVLTQGLDLFAGLTFSEDGERIAVARNDSSGGKLDLLNIADGAAVARYQANDAMALYPLEMRGDQLWTAALEAAGWALWELKLQDGALERVGRWDLGAQHTRGWTLSPDGGEVALELRNGREFQVVVRSLREEGDAAPQVAESQDWQRERLRPLDAESRHIDDAAGPAWRPNGELTVGRWSGARGFTVPFAWDPDGRWLAVAAYEGAGPGDAGQRWTGIVGAERGLERVEQAEVYAIGWWSG